jgi:uncharacterized GH25 family protein
MKIFQIRRVFRPLIFVVAGVVLSYAVPAHAQETSSIQGVAVDSQGAAIPGAKVTAMCDCKECPNRPCTECCPASFSGTATTNSDGQFRIENVPAGVYRVRGEVSGFKTVEVHGVRVSSQSTSSVTLTFEVGRTDDPDSTDENARLRVKIIDRVTDKPLENATVTLLLQCDCRKECPLKPCSECCPSERQVFTNITDASGVITFDGPPGIYRVDTSYRAFSKDSMVRLAAGESEKLTVTLVVKEKL